MKQLMTAVATALCALSTLSTGVAFAAEPAKKEAAPAKPAASAPTTKPAASALTKAAAKPAEKKEKKGGC